MSLIVPSSTGGKWWREQQHSEHPESPVCWRFLQKYNCTRNDQVLKPIRKEPSVNESERILSSIVQNKFFSLWCYPSLFRSVGNGKELADLTIYFNNHLILFSDKGHVKFQDDRDVHIAWKRWYRGAVKESAKQLHGAESFIRNYPHRVFLNNKLEDPFPYDLANPDLKIHLVAVTRGIGDHAKSFFDSIALGSSGTLGYAYQVAEDVLIEKPFFVGDVDQAKTFVHVLDESGIHLLLEELCTPPDFIHYLETKEKTIRSRRFLLSAGEEETLASYLQEDGGNGFGDLRLPLVHQGHCFQIPEGEWRHYRQTVAYALRHGHKQKAKLWNEIIARFANAITDACVGEASDLPFIDHANAVQVLASENMYSSSFLASALFEKFSSVPEGARSARTVPSISTPGRMYVFVFFPWDDDYVSYDEYRQERTACMQLYAHVARYKFQKAKEILIFGADTRGRPGGSETIFAIDATVPMTGNERVMAQQIMKNHQVLDNVSERMIKVSDFSEGVRRNAICPCGSKKKYKKCCMSSGLS
ncbi:SEC-C domain-containing protein [Pseudomonas fluorescens]|uniref:SEC-C domain-containing protein n=1 Tax=Pseudomonas fluorescens TaxID=294 RepID=UPI001A9D3A33|nr:SEC-C domain-containing protein [Pseudomonas fluorescens]